MAHDIYHQAFFERLMQVVEKRNALFVPVRLICNLDELLNRVSNEQRMPYYKTRDTRLIRKRFAESEVFYTHLPTELTLDVTQLSPQLAAIEIMQWVKQQPFPVLG